MNRFITEEEYDEWVEKQSQRVSRLEQNLKEQLYELELRQREVERIKRERKEQKESGAVTESNRIL